MLSRIKLRFMRLVIFYICSQYRKEKDIGIEEVNKDKMHILSESADLLLEIKDELSSLK
jgi:hypothetical protein